MCMLKPWSAQFIALLVLICTYSAGQILILILTANSYRKTYQSDKKGKAAVKAAKMTASGSGPAAGAKLE